MTRNVRLEHLVRLSDDQGLFEHAAGVERRVEHGYCTDDNARLLMVATRERDAGDARRLAQLALAFVLEAQAPDGRVCNRLDAGGEWTDTPTTDDCWGRAVRALGWTAACHRDDVVRRRAGDAFDRSARQRSPWLRSMAFAALGACEVAEREPDHDGAFALLADYVAMVPPVAPGPWRWPEQRLSYANAAIAEALVGAASLLERPDDIERGLALLRWLLDVQTRDGHLSVVGTAGRGPTDDGSPQFDQQPIEVACLADACWRAFDLTGDAAWAKGVFAAARWFEGENDVGVPMIDDVSGGAYDGLEPAGVNANQGAESTLAFVSTMQRVRAMTAAV